MDLELFPEEVRLAGIEAANYGVGSRSEFERIAREAGYEEPAFTGKRETKGEAFARIWHELDQKDQRLVQTKLIAYILKSERDPRDSYVGEEAERAMKRLKDAALRKPVIGQVLTFLI
ncbi:hypothetical protein [Corynebacterium sp. Marseille-P3884]|uniref:hypothetical protein n=1 Tax=Corynebacterium sp. Marseille-P3884 TaxID=2495409 RepID=UPI001B3448CB|nr:hypothetical protein [Corynebacterium sp. Marseille-P3884]MBP3949183.1 hypothetical protein [Corynebacterium sp. Marseille-P3884]